MLGRLILIVVLIPLVELVLLAQLLNRTNFLVTLAVVLVTGIVGINLARRQGLRAWKAIHQQTAAGRSPSAEILNGVMILLAGAFLITPGILTDIVGFLLLVPRFRMQLGSVLTHWFKARTIATFQSATQTGVWTTDSFRVDEPTGEQPSVRVIDPRTLTTDGDAEQTSGR